MCALLPVRELATERATPGEKIGYGGYPTLEKSCTTTDHERLNLRNLLTSERKLEYIARTNE